MITDFLDKCKDILMETVQKLTGHDKRVVLALIAEGYGPGGQSFVASELNVGRDTIRKGQHEVNSGIKCEDAFNMRGRKKITDKLPHLEDDLKIIIDSQSQTDPKFQSTRLYTRLTISEIRQQLITQKHYEDTELPTNQTLNTLVNNIGYTLKKVQKTKPLKKISETNAIFENLNKIHEEVENDEETVRLSMDAKDRVKIGNFSRGGKNRVLVEAFDHDFGNEFVVPFGIMNVKDGTVDISIAKSKVTADYIVDRLEEYWVSNSFQGRKKVLVLNLDNGPECNSRRTQFIKRIVELAVKYNIIIHLAYYPPYHSKYNPIERVWGALEQHWNGDLLENIDIVVGFTQSMIYNAQHPNVTVVEQVYETGKKLPKEIMNIYETALERMDGIGKWFVSINPLKCQEMLNNVLLE